MTDRSYITTTIPYVNARPHLGHALEAVQADVLARHLPARRGQVRFQTGTDDNSLKNVLAAAEAGTGVQEFVDANAAAFAALAGPLALSTDDLIRTSSDPRHRPGVERLWRACAASGDLYRKHYEGLYCVGCEQFWLPAELDDGRCPEHGTAPGLVAEENWFFRLSRHGDSLLEAIDSGRLRIESAGRRNEVRSFIAAGLEDFSVSRSVTRARGWGIAVPDDPGQVIYVWFDALGNYLTALGYGAGDDGVQRWWAGADRRVHVLGKGVIRFHAVYWPAILLSAGLPLPTDILVHDYLTVAGGRISKSGGNSVDPVALARDYGTDALRWWLLREVPRTGDTDFTAGRLIARADDELANGIGNLVHRVTSLLHQHRGGLVPGPVTSAAGDSLPALPGSVALAAARESAPSAVSAALAAGDFRTATAAVWAIADEGNKYVSQSRPWLLAAAAREGDRVAGEQLDSVLGLLIKACRDLARELEPFLPALAASIAVQCSSSRWAGSEGRLPLPQPVFARLNPRRRTAKTGWGSHALDP
ncbi:MAG: methionine--tRNA ligase [Streptosporangiaceae bacterium]